MRLLLAILLACAPAVHAAAQDHHPKLHTLHAFAGHPSDGSNVESPLVAKDGVLYGAAFMGGSSKKCPAGCGTIFSLTPPASPNDAWSEQTLYTFANGAGGDGDGPTGIAMGGDGTIYGTVGFGGPADKGSVFSLTPPSSPGSAWTFRTLYSFTGGADGGWPISGLAIGSGGVLYGTADTGGPAKEGLVFSLTPPATAGGPWTENVLYSFSNAEGTGATGLVVQPGDAGDVLYGVLTFGGENRAGTIFSLTPPATLGGAWSESVIFQFQDVADGSGPESLVPGPHGGFYGVAGSGGHQEFGTVFSLKPPASPGASWTEQTLYRFSGTDGNAPISVSVAPGGTLYGVTVWGGSGNCHTVKSFTACGVIFSLTPPGAGGGHWTEQVLHSFTGHKDGKFPRASVLIGKHNILYGSTTQGVAKWGDIFALKP